MTIDVLVCTPQGQRVEQREVGDDWGSTPTAPDITYEERLRADIDFLAALNGVEL